MDESYAIEAMASEHDHRPAAAADGDHGDAKSRSTSSKHTNAQDTISQSQFDPDTCRICRGEGTSDEPLFYPCKCSGSIKYVHQDCLMEWLSHSQKKHCELCKTPFRFTKLYAPNMPKTVPFYVFVSHITKYLFRNIMVWARGALVLMVWLVWLPYLMRRIWSALFWISDEGFGPVFSGIDNSSTSLSNSILATTGTATCPSSPLHAETTSTAALQRLMTQVPHNAASQTTTSIYGINITTDNPFSNILLNIFLGNFHMGMSSSRGDATPTLQHVAAPTPTSHPSLLSEVRFLRKLAASSPTIGNFTIDVFEGQIITVLVIVCFILIILVRDYVVQQQPDINLRAAFAAAQNADPAVVEGAVAEGRDRHGPNAEQQAEIERLRGLIRENEALMDQDRRARVVNELADEANEPGRVGYPREYLRQPTPTYEEDADGGPAEKYVRLYREADGDGDKISELARQRDLEEELAYFLNTGYPREEADQDAAHRTPEESSTQGEVGSQPDWDWPDEGPSSSDKGKGRMVEESTSASEDPTPTSRPRSATDVPQRGGINPLGHNNWSFSNTPHDSASIEPPTTSEAQVADPRDGRGTAASQWSYVTPASSTLAESGSSSYHGRTPSSSDNNDAVYEPTRVDSQGGVDAAQSEFDTVQDEGLPALMPADDPGPPIGTPELNALLVQGPETEHVEDAGDRERPRPGGLAQRVADFMWRDVEAIPAHELPPLQDAADDFFDPEPEAVIGVADDPLLQAQERDQEAMAAAAAAGIDAEAEAIEDAEDLEGILELLGMRGPIAGLFQNALFCAFLVTITLFLGVFMPYNLGRFAIWLVANPIRPIRMVFSISRMVQDFAMLLAGFVSSLFLGSVKFFASIFIPEVPQVEVVGRMMERSWTIMENAGGKLRDSGLLDFLSVSGEELRNFSIVSHQALISLKNEVNFVWSTLIEVLVFIFGGNYAAKQADILSCTAMGSASVLRAVKDLPGLLSIPSSWVIDLGSSEIGPLDQSLASWGAMDRLWAILGGYLAICVTAALYLGRGSIVNGRFGQEWEATLIDVLVQASGVMKVILIIGIEMLVFPLYCGLLLDVALLPLFENTTIMSRVIFTVNYPLTSMFVHWFVGTGYMFHFALFVSMCRKIMRKGVLYFIRDPDDAEFHPVRDVLERNVTTQLRKILFSAFVYGALVIVCLGGVVWALSYGFHNVLPIYYSSNEPVLEFPIDLLFYNFLMPLAVKFYRPSDGLHTMYTWWFRKLARALRLTWFLFGERRIDEEGILQLAPHSSAHGLPWWRTVFLEIEKQSVVPKTWKDTFEGGHAKPASPLTRAETRISNFNKKQLVETGQLIPDGRFVRAPASDQVKIPKGARVFFDVNEANERQDGKPDGVGSDLYSSSTYQFVYIPPNFRLRIFLFILWIWLFAAATGVGFTIIPLIFGRAMFRMFIPADIRTNDIYAFSIGLYILGSLSYFVFHSKNIYLQAKDWVHDTAANVLARENVRRAATVVTYAARLLYSYLFLLIVFPFMVSSLMELYIMIPVDTYMYGNVTLNGATNASVTPRHTVRVMQTWTIGVIYLKLASRVIVHWRRNGRLAAAIRAVLRHGWLEPDVRVLTRAFVVPGVFLWALAVLTPLMLARTAIWYMEGPSEAAVVLVYRFCFAATLVCALAVLVVRSILGVFRSWRVRIKDEAYLIGERLHNFSSPPAQPLGERERRRTRVGWE